MVGNSTTAQNVGNGAGIFTGITNGNNIQFRSISATGSSVSIVQTPTKIIISGAPSGGGSSGGGIGWSCLANGSTVAGCGNLPTGTTIYQDTLYGVRVGSLLTTGGTGNTGSGYEALRSTCCGSYNVAVGNQALWSNDIGCNNVAIGSQALFSGGCGCDNVAIGYRANYNNNSGCWNIAIGCEALCGGIPASGCFNVAIGIQALACNINGFSNIALGAFALQNNTTGCLNVAMGYQALINNISGCDNIAQGYQALYNNGMAYRFDAVTQFQGIPLPGQDANLSRTTLLPIPLRIRYIPTTL